MAVIEVTMPPMTTEEMEAWYALGDVHRLGLCTGERVLQWRPLHLPRLPRLRSDVVQAAPVLFVFDSSERIDRWQAEIRAFGHLSGSIVPIVVIEGDSVDCTLSVRGWEPDPRRGLLDWLRR